MRIRRIINQNLNKIILIVITAIILIAIIHTLNYFAKQDNLKARNVITNEGENIKTDTSVQPIISQGFSNITTNDIASYKEKVEEFVKLCNEGKSDRAYDMLSKECKEIMYYDYDSFYKNYCKNNFASNKSYSIQSWSNNIFKVDIQDDLLSTGGKITNNIQDFVSVVLEENEYKLNINSYIGRQEINKQTIQDGITFKVLKKDMYMKYEKYYLEITNNGENDVLLDDLKNTSTLYLLDTNNIKYTMTSDELTKEQIYIRKGATMNMSIKFTNSYTVNRVLKNIVFSNASIKDENEPKDGVEYKVNL